MSKALDPISLAIAKASWWHGEQKRKYTNDDYIVHPIEVMNFLALFTQDEAVMVAAILHDVVEDTPATVKEVEAIFGEDVAKLVFGMSEPEVPAGTNRGERKEIYRRHLEKQCWRTKMIKFGDIYSNTKDITMHDPDFAVVYLAEIQRTINSIDDNRIPLLLRQMVKEQVKLAKLYVDQFQANKKLVKKLSNIRTITETIKGELL